MGTVQIRWPADHRWASLGVSRWHRPGWAAACAIQSRRAGHRWFRVQYSESAADCLRPARHSLQPSPTSKAR